jgi:hypothetical protein
MVSKTTAYMFYHSVIGERILEIMRKTKKNQERTMCSKGIKSVFRLKRKNKNSQQ